jgi:hypothetical protein
MNEPTDASHPISSTAEPVPPVGQGGERSPLAALEPSVAAVRQPIPEAPVASGTAATVVTVVEDGRPRVGRYTHGELAAMQGKRGRKPPEFYQLFPKTDAPTTGSTPKTISSAGRTAHRPRVPTVRISSALIGDHSIDELLELIGVTGRKPVAYDILRQAAQVFADRGALDLPKATQDPLAQQIANAPARIRELIAELIRLGKH